MDNGRNFLGCSHDVYDRNASASNVSDREEDWRTTVLYLSQACYRLQVTKI